MSTRTEAPAESSPAAWFGVLAGPIAWGGQILLTFGIPAAVVCAPGSGGAEQIGGVGMETVLQVINAIATAVTLVAFAVAARLYLRVHRTDATEARRATWMAAAGMFISAMFVFLTASKLASALFLDGCSTSP